MMKEEEAVTSDAMNVDDNIIYSTSDSDNNRIGEDDCNLNQINQVWGTWEELLLTCAVKRHGFKNWDSVAKEVSSRSSSLNASAGNCRIKYRDLKRRFEDSGDGDKNSESAEEEKVGEITWVEKLRSLRMAELRRDVQRCDDSILSLQLKVKKLEEEKDGDTKPDLKDDDIKPARLNRETTESDRENRSMNESNSTGSVDKTADHDRLTGDKTVKVYVNSRNPDPDPVYKVEEGRTVSRRSEMSNSGELGESGTSIGYKKRKGSNYRSGGDSSNRGGSGGDIKSAGDKSQPLIEIIKRIRFHPRGSVFESRLRSQETKNYKSLIRQHLDIKIIERKLEKGSYVSSSLSFYRDLKLLFTNAIVYFPTSSSESVAAHELRTLVSNEMKKPGHVVAKAKAESSVSKQKSSLLLPLVACKKKSSVPKKTSPSSSFKQKDEKKSQDVVEEKKTVTTSTTTARSSRRTSNVVAKDTKTGRAKNTTSSNKKQTDSKTESSNDDDEEETPKAEKKIASDKKKSVADFLKRIKKNSPQKAKETTSKDQKNKKKSDDNVKKEAKPRELRSNSTGKKKVEIENNSSKSLPKRKQPKKEAEEVVTGTGKRGRESGKDNKQQPKKRSRR